MRRIITHTWKCPHCNKECDTEAEAREHSLAGHEQGYVTMYKKELKYWR